MQTRDGEGQRTKNKGVANNSHFQKEGTVSAIPPKQLFSEEAEVGKEEVQQNKEKSYADAGGADMPPSDPSNPNQKIAYPLLRRRREGQDKPYQRLESKNATPRDFRKVEPFQFKKPLAYQSGFGENQEKKNDGARLLPRSENKLNDVPYIPKTRGRTLPDDQKKPFELAMGNPLGAVRIHDDGKADEAAQKMGAEAFTSGNDIYFAKGIYEPGTPKGDKILAHELIHVKQNIEGKVPTGKEKPVSSPSDSLEQEAYGQENELAKKVRRERGQSNDDPALNSKAAIPNEPNLAENGEDEALEDEIAEKIAVIPEAESKEAETTEAPISRAGQLPKLEKGGLSKNKQGKSPAKEAAVENIPSENEKQPSETAISPNIKMSIVPIVPVLATKAPSLHKEAPIEVAQDSSENKDIREDGTVFALESSVDIKNKSVSLAEKLEAQSTQKLSEVEQVIEARKGQLKVSADLADQQIETQYATSANLLNTETSTQITAIHQFKAGRIATVTAFAENEINRFRAGKEAGISRAREILSQKKQAAIEAGETEATRAMIETESYVTEIMAYANSADASGEQPEAEAKLKILTDIARDTAAKCRKTGNDIAQRVRGEAGALSSQYDQMFQDYLAGMGEQESEISNNIDSFKNETIAKITQGATEGGNILQQLENQGLIRLGNEKSNAQSKVRGLLEGIITQIDSSFSAIRTSYEKQVAAATAQLRDYGNQSAKTFRGLVGIEKEEVEQVSSKIQQNIQGYYDANNTALDSWTSQTIGNFDAYSTEGKTNIQGVATEGLTLLTTATSNLTQKVQKGAGQTQEGLGKIADSAQQEMSRSIDEILQEYTKATSAFETQLETVHQRGLEAFSKLVDDGLQSESDLVAETKTKMDKALGQVGSKYRQLKSEAESRSENGNAQPRIHRGFWGSITSFFGDMIESVRNWFADTFGDFWGGLLFGIIFSIVVIAVGFVILSGIGAVLAVLAISAEVIAIVLLVIGIVAALFFTIYNRFAEYYDDFGEGPGFFGGVGLVLLGIVDLTGIPFIIESAIGTTLSTGRELSTFERGERLGMGLVFFIALASSAKNIFRSKPRVKPQGRTEGIPEGTGKIEGTREPLSENTREIVNESGKVKPETKMADLLNKVTETGNAKEPFRRNRKRIPNNEKIKGQPEAGVKADAAREAYAAEKAASIPGVKEVIMGEAADMKINPESRPGTKPSADVVAVTTKGKYIIGESKGRNITKGLEQMKTSAERLGKNLVIRFELTALLPLEAGYKVVNGRLFYDTGGGIFKEFHIHQKPVHVNGIKSE